MAIKLGIAPIAWTNDDMPDLGSENTFEQCISEMALAGFTGSEVGNKYPRDTKVLKKALDMRGMQIASAWYSTFLTTEPYEKTEAGFITFMDFLYEMGARHINVAEQGHSVQGMLNVPVISEKPCFTDAEWDNLTSGLNKLGELAAKKGMKMCYHHHMGTGIQTLTEIDRLMENTTPEFVYLLFDTGHLAFSNENPKEVLQKYIGRIAHVHLKDIRRDIFAQVKKQDMSFLDAVRAGVFTVPGDGMIDFPPLFEILSAHDYAGWFIVEAEQDPSNAATLEKEIKKIKNIAKYTNI